MSTTTYNASRGAARDPATARPAGGQGTVGGGGARGAAATDECGRGRVVTGIDTSVWLLAGITDCGTCGQALIIHPSGRDRRFYLCPACDELHPADPAETLVAATVRERDWVRAQHRGSRETWRAAWSPTRVEVRRRVDRLVDRVLLAPTNPTIDVRWRPAAVLPHDCPYLGDWTSPVPSLGVSLAPITDAPSRPNRTKGEP